MSQAERRRTQWALHIVHDDGDGDDEHDSVGNDTGRVEEVTCPVKIDTKYGAITFKLDPRMPKGTALLMEKSNPNDVLIFNIGELPKITVPEGDDRVVSEFFCDECKAQTTIVHHTKWLIATCPICGMDVERRGE